MWLTWKCISRLHLVYYVHIVHLTIQYVSPGRALSVCAWCNVHIVWNMFHLGVHFQCAPGVLCAHCAPDYSICFSWMCIVKVRLVYEICFTWMCIVSLHLICVMCTLCNWMKYVSPECGRLGSWAGKLHTCKLLPCGTEPRQKKGVIFG